MLARSDVWWRKEITWLQLKVGESSRMKKRRCKGGVVSKKGKSVVPGWKLGTVNENVSNRKSSVTPGTRHLDFRDM